MNIESERLYNSKEVCSLLCISVRTLRNYTAKNLLKYSRTATNRLLFKGEDIKEFMSRGNESKA